MNRWILFSHSPIPSGESRPAARAQVADQPMNRASRQLRQHSHVVVGERQGQTYRHIRGDSGSDEISTTRLFCVWLTSVNSVFILYWIRSVRLRAFRAPARQPSRSRRPAQPKLADWPAKAGAKGGIRTPRAFRLPDPKSGASASSATFACAGRAQRRSARRAGDTADS